RALTFGNDGVFYGVTAFGGDLNFGTLFKVLPPETPDLLRVTKTSRAQEVSFAGTSGKQYELFRSADLTQWTLLNTVQMPVSGVVTHTDLNPPPGRAYYRAAWMPSP